MSHPPPKDSGHIFGLECRGSGGGEGVGGGRFGPKRFSSMTGRDFRKWRLGEITFVQVSKKAFGRLFDCSSRSLTIPNGFIAPLDHGICAIIMGEAVAAR